MKTFALLICIGVIPYSTFAGPRTSASYSITTDTINAAGARTQSTSYKNDGGAGGITGISSVASPAETAKHGYAAQLYDIIALALSAPPSLNLNESASRQLSAAPLADDATTLAALNPSAVAWSIISGPITSISSSGLATAATVYQNTPSRIGGAAQGLSGQFDLTVLDSIADNFGAYAGDGLGDDWQVQYFGQNNPNAGPNIDADGSGHGNRFKFTAGLNPLDGSRFILSIQPVPGQASRKNLIFSPLVAGRTYTVQSTPSLITPTWAALPQSTQSDNGTVRTVTDLSASPPPKFYRVKIAKP